MTRREFRWDGPSVRVIHPRAWAGQAGCSERFLTPFFQQSAHLREVDDLGYVGALAGGMRTSSKWKLRLEAVAKPKQISH